MRYYWGKSNSHLYVVLATNLGPCYSRANGRPAHSMELIVVVLLSYKGVAPRMRPWIMTTEQRTTITMGMKTIRHTICLSREQALEYRRYQTNNFSTWNWLPRSYDRTPLGYVEKFSLDGIEHAKA
jgi:hypothetical protein